MVKTYASVVAGDVQRFPSMTTAVLHGSDSPKIDGHCEPSSLSSAPQPEVSPQTDSQGFTSVKLLSRPMSDPKKFTLLLPKALLCLMWICSLPSPALLS